jgi:hypothetical protein
LVVDDVLLVLEFVVVVAEVDEVLLEVLVDVVEFVVDDVLLVLEFVVVVVDVE